MGSHRGEGVCLRGCHPRAPDLVQNRRKKKKKKRRERERRQYQAGCEMIVPGVGHARLVPRLPLWQYRASGTTVQDAV